MTLKWFAEWLRTDVPGYVVLLLDRAKICQYRFWWDAGGFSAGFFGAARPRKYFGCDKLPGE
jgi:hypothetical protein